MIARWPAMEWAITPEHFQLVLAIRSRGELFPDALARARADMGDEPLKNVRPALEVRDGVAVVPVSGPLMRHAGILSAISGASSYEQIGRDLAAAEKDPAVCAILLKIDSPGGEAAGVGPLAECICDCSKPIVAYVDGNAASAAYHLASAARKVYATPGAFLGSIGVRCTLTDDSKAQEERGEVEIEIVSSQSPDKRDTPVDKSVRARAQQRVDDLADLFVAAVAKGRKVSTEKVLSDFGAGDVLIASKAVAAGMADRVSTYEEALAAVRAMGTKKTQTGAPPVDQRRVIMSKLLAERLNALASLDLVQGNTMQSDLKAAAVDAQKMQDDLQALKAEQVNTSVELSGYRFEAAIRTGWTERRITSPAQETALRSAYAGDLQGLAKYLSVQTPAPALVALVPAPGATNAAEDAAKRATGGQQANGNITTAFGYGGAK